MPLVALRHAGKTWPINDFVQACLDGECSFPATVAAVIIKSIQAYSNHNTISGSQLHAECDYKRVLEENLDYTQDIEDLWHASFRGAAIHSLMETCRDDPRFKDWLFEKRFFAAIDPEGTIFPLHVPGAEKSPNWENFQKTCDILREEGCIILSGALDAYDGKNHLGLDYKTKSKVGPYTQVSDSWRQQMSLYTLLARLHGYKVSGFKVSAMDATGVVVLDVALPHEEWWIQNYLIPRARVLTKHQSYTREEVMAINSGEVEPPEDFPKPVKNYLCDGGKSGKVYCALKDQCPAWRKPDAQ